jgi:hypothetical protein
MEPLTPAQKRQIAKEYLALFGKSLDSRQSELIANAPATANPLFLRVLLEELRVHGVFEELNAKIQVPPQVLHSTRGEFAVELKY